MKMSPIADECVLVRDRNVIAVALSIMPGAGQFYKGHYAEALLLLFAMPIVIWTGLLLSLATVGLGLLLPIAFWAFIAVDAYYEDDWRKHHWLGIV